MRADRQTDRQTRWSKYIHTYIRFCIAHINSIESLCTNRGQSNNNNNNRDDIYGALIMAKSLREFPRFIWWMQTKHRVAANPQNKPIDLDSSYAHCRIIHAMINDIALYYRTINSAHPILRITNIRHRHLTCRPRCRYITSMSVLVILRRKYTLAA